MLPVQFILLLVMVALPGEMAGAAREKSGAILVPDEGSMWLGLGAYSVLVSVNVLIGLFALMRTRLAVRELHATLGSSAPVHAKMDEFYFRARIFTIILTGVLMFSTPMPDVFFYWRDQTRIIRMMPLAAELLFLLPPVGAWMAIWAASYYLETAGRERAMPFRLAHAMPVHEMPPLGSYLVMQARHNFFPLIFLFIVSCLDKVATRYSQAGVITSLIGSIVMLVGVPVILTTLWSTAPMPEALGARLVGVARMYRLRFRKILLWKTHQMTLNAAILGWFPGARYFLMSDVLLETNTDEQLEAIFAHEVGHGVHWHIPWYMATLGGALMLAGGITGTALWLSPFLAAHEDIAGSVMMFGLALGLGGYAIYTVAPRFEHQADWFACRHMARVMMTTTQPRTIEPCPVELLPEAMEGALLTGPAGEPITMGQYLAGAYPHSGPSTKAAQDTPSPAAAAVPQPQETAMQSGTEIFVSALEGLIEKTQRARDKRDIMHPSINDRVALLRKLATDVTAEHRFLMMIFRTRVAIVGLLIAGGAAFAVAAMLPEPSNKSAATAPAIAAERNTR